MEIEIIKQLGIALILSGLVGLEREKYAQSSHKNLFAGFRTYMLIGVLGVLSHFLYFKFPIFSYLTMFSVFGLILTAYLLSRFREGFLGLTNEISALLVFLNSFFLADGYYLLATLLTLFLVVVLKFKDSFHKWANTISTVELISTLQFIFIAFVVLPLLPNESFGYLDFFNPYLIWLMLVFISGISYFSYFLIKIFGEKNGICISGFLAGLISSTALTLSFSEQSKKRRTIVNPFVVAIVVASSAMFFRVLFEVFVVNPELLLDLFIPFLAMGFSGLICALFMFTRFSGGKDVENEDSRISADSVKNPFRFWPALKFATFFAVVLLFVKIADHFFGDIGIYLTSFISGVMDVDAITISISTLAKNGLSKDIAVNSIFIASITNTFAKGIMFFVLGNRKVALKILSIFIVMFVVGFFSLVLL